MVNLINIIKYKNNIKIDKLERNLTTGEVIFITIILILLFQYMLTYKSDGLLLLYISKSQYKGLKICIILIMMILYLYILIKKYL
jgi:hypothetical protein